MKSLKEIESIGWGFFAVMFVPASIISCIIVWINTYDVNGPVVRIALGLFIGAVASGIITWAINHLLYMRTRKEYEANRKAARKSKKKKKKKK